MKTSDETFIKIIDTTPLVSIDLVIMNNAYQVLLGKRENRPAQGFWFVPGGRIRKNELLADALSRIAQQELGLALEIDQGHLLGAYNHVYKDNFLGVPDINTHYVVLGYQFVLQDNIPVMKDEQHSELAWVNIDEALAREDVHENTKAYLTAPKLS